jgi:hypothetical protein
VSSRVEKEKTSRGRRMGNRAKGKGGAGDRRSKIPAMGTWLRAKKERTKRCWKKKTERREKGPIRAKEDAKGKNMEMKMEMKNQMRGNIAERGERTCRGLDGGKKRLKEKEVRRVCACMRMRVGIERGRVFFFCFFFLFFFFFSFSLFFVFAPHGEGGSCMAA